MAIARLNRRSSFLLYSSSAAGTHINSIVGLNGSSGVNIWLVNRLFDSNLASFFSVPQIPLAELLRSPLSEINHFAIKQSKSTLKNDRLEKL
jgi:hypothetical protein